MKNKRTSQAEILIKHSTALKNAIDHKVISKAISALGYTVPRWTRGKELLNKAKDYYALSTKKTNLSIDARNKFDEARSVLDKQYRLHRKKAKMVFKNDPIMLKKLSMDGSYSMTYAKWLDTVKAFYQVASTKQEVQEALKPILITNKEIALGIQYITELESARRKYIAQKGEAQIHTRRKSKSLSKLESWMSDFYTVAKIALVDKPQHLEVLGIVVKT